MSITEHNLIIPRSFEIQKPCNQKYECKAKGSDGTFEASVFAVRLILEKSCQ